jgi:replicative superfamily II helicase
MIGRAGRIGLETEGVAVIMTELQKVSLVNHSLKSSIRV